MYHIMKILSRLMCCLPLRTCRVLGDFLGEITWVLVPPKRKKLAVDNIIKCLKLPLKDAESMAKKSWTRFGYMIIEVLRFPKMKEDINRYIRIEGKEHMEKALSLGKGAVIATAHSGNWELLGGALALNGFPIVGVAQKQKNGAFDRFINEYRSLIGIHVTYKSGVKEMFKMIGEGWVIGLLMDQDAGMQNGIILDFFGRATSCVTGPAAIARFQGAPILPVFISQNSDGTHLVKIHEAVFVEKTRDKHEDMKKTTALLTQIIEQHIRSCPNEWFWLHDRWKSVEKRG